MKTYNHVDYGLPQFGDDRIISDDDAPGERVTWMQTRAIISAMDEDDDVSLFATFADRWGWNAPSVPLNKASLDAFDVLLVRLRLDGFLSVDHVAYLRHIATKLVSADAKAKLRKMGRGFTVQRERDIYKTSPRDQENHSWVDANPNRKLKRK